MAHPLVDYVLIPLSLPVILVWLAVARVVSFAVGMLVLPPYLMSRRLYWAVPIARTAWQVKPKWSGLFQRLGFESAYCMNMARRFLTLPLRRNVPDVYILGFPKCGTTALAQYLMQHPAISGIDGLPYDPALSKESHFFNGVLGPRTTHSRLLYRSFFPTVLTRWWNEVVRGSGPWKCMDACPLNACLPHVADRIKRMSPNAKLIFMVRDPVDAAFSAEIMLRNTGMPLDWSFMEDIRAGDQRFTIPAEDIDYFENLSKVGPFEALPKDLPARIYTKSSSVLYFSHFADRIAPYLSRFPRENILFMEFREFNAQPQKSVESVMEFIGVDPQRGGYEFTHVPMWTGERRGRRMHPAVKQRLVQYFELPNQRLFALVGKSYPWGMATVRGEFSTDEQGSEIVHEAKKSGDHVIISVEAALGGSEKPGKALSSAIDLLPAVGVRRKQSEVTRRTISVSAVV